MSGFLSMILKILAAADLPSEIFLMAGVSCVKLKPAMRILKKMTSTSPAVYTLPPFKRFGQLSVSQTQLEPNQKPREYDMSMKPKREPMPIPMNTPYLVEFLVTLTRVSEYLSAQNCQPLSCFTVLMPAIACSAFPPASEYSFSNSLLFLAMAVEYRYPPSPMAGKEASETRVISHPLMNAMMKPAMNMAMVMMRVDTFYPIASWKAKESVANLVDSSDWLIVSNHPISWLSKLLRYCFLQAIPCLSPVIIQHPNMPHPAKRAPTPISIKLNMTSLEVSTILLLSPKLLVMLPHSNAKDGRAVPIAQAQMVPIVIRKQSYRVANRKRQKQPTCSISGFFQSQT